MSVLAAEPGDFLRLPPAVESVNPVTVHRLRDADGGLLGASGAAFSRCGGLFVWGDAEDQVRRAISRVDLKTGTQQRLFTGPSPLTVHAAPDGSGLWFFAGGQLHFLDDATDAVMKVTHGEVDKVLRANTYYRPEPQADGSLLLEWWSYDEIPILFGTRRAQWKLPAPSRGKVFSRAFLPRPGGDGAVRYEVDVVARLHRADEPSRVDGQDATSLPDGGFRPPLSTPLGTSGEMEPLALDGGQRLQPFELRRHPKTLAPCAANAEVVASGGGYTMTSNISTPTCARVCGVFVENARDGRWARTLFHGLGMPGVKLMRGDTLYFAARRDTAAPSSVSVWKVREAKLISRLALPKDLGAQTDLVFVSPLEGNVVGVTGYPVPAVVVWPLPPSS